MQFIKVVAKVYVGNSVRMLYLEGRTSRFRHNWLINQLTIGFLGKSAGELLHYTRTSMVRNQNNGK
jgi:hypothetical protein